MEFGDMLVNVAMAALLAFLVERVLEWLVAEPLEHYAPEVDRFFLRYVAFLAGGALSYLVSLNIFEALPVPETIGLILTAVVVGCGLEVLHDLVKGSFARTDDLERAIENLALAEKYIGELEWETSAYE